MSTQMSMFNQNTIPAHLQALQKEAPVINLGGDADTRNRIALKGGRFVLRLASTQEKVLEVLKLPVIIVGAHDYVSRAYYATKWSPGVKARPTCFSGDGITPSNASDKRQADACAICPQNQKGSSEVGGKACSFFKRLVVLIAGKGTPFILDVKSMSVFGTGNTQEMKYGLNEYSKILNNQGINPSVVVTELSFDSAVTVPKIFFTPTGYITEDMAKQVKNVLDDTVLMKEYKSVDLESLGDEQCELEHLVHVACLQ